MAPNTFRVISASLICHDVCSWTLAGCLVGTNTPTATTGMTVTASAVPEQVRLLETYTFVPTTTNLLTVHRPTRVPHVPSL